MAQRVYVLARKTKWNVLGIYTNIRQVRKSVKLLESDPSFCLDEIILQEIRMNEGPDENCGKIVTYMLHQNEEKSN